jgi:hypothetical protein
LKLEQQIKEQEVKNEVKLNEYSIKCAKFEERLQAKDDELIKLK